MTRDELLRVMSWEEFCEWLVYDQIEPLGESRGDYQAAIVAATIANVNRSKGQKPYSPADFLPNFIPETKEQRAAKLHAKMKAVKQRYEHSTETEELRKLLN